MSNTPTEFPSNLNDDLASIGLPGVKMTQAVIDAPPEREKEAQVYNETRVRIVLEDNDNIPPSGLFLGLNGKGFMLKSNMEADVPVGVVNILNDAVMSLPIVDEQTKQVTGFRNRLRFPYRIVATIAPDKKAA